MKKYRVNVNGSLYEVEIEEMNAPATMSAPTPAAKPAAAPAGGAQVKAPMPGAILDVRVQNGQKVNKGDVLVILEAMKMENEITAECDGVVKQILVGSSTVVNTDDVLAVI